MIASRQEGADGVHGTTMAVGAVAGLVVAAVVTDAGDGVQTLSGPEAT